MNWVWAVKNSTIYDLNLHLHTVLSPCAGLNMTPAQIIDEAHQKEIDIIGITDHNSAGNVEVAVELAREQNIKVIPGLEVETKEEVHCLCLFEKVREALKLQDFIRQHLPDQKNVEDFFGYQIKTNLKDEYEQKEEIMLAAAVNISLSRLLERVYEEDGILIPAHVLRSQGLIYQLGFIPQELDLPVLEVADEDSISELCQEYPQKVFIKNQDSHRLAEIKRGFSLKLPEPSFAAVKSVFVGRQKEKIII